MDVKTPGVYIQEVSLFPPSIAEVETAIPAFIGYTEYAYDGNLKAMAEITPVKVSSLVEFKMYFGEGYDVQEYTISVDTSNDNLIAKATPDRRYFLYDAIRQFYDNGGGDCYIVSVGKYGDNIDDGDLSDGIDALKKYDEPTLLLFPDGTLLLDSSDDPDYSKYADVQKKALVQCYNLQDRFAIFDLMEGNKKEDSTTKPITNFRDKIGVNYLKYGAAYYPWIMTSYDINLMFRQLSYEDSSVSPATTISDLSSILSTDDMVWVTTVKERVAETDSVTTIKGLTQLNLLENGIDYIKSSLKTIEKEINSTSLYNSLKTKFTSYMMLVADLAQAFPNAVTAIAASTSSSQLDNDITDFKADTDLINTLIDLAKLEKNTAVTANNTSDWDATKKKTHYDLLNGVWFNSQNYNSLTADTTVYLADKSGILAIIKEVKTNILTQLLESYEDLYNATVFYEEQSDTNLFSNLVFFKGIKDLVKETMQTIPPSGAIAGIYATTDRTRGVWKAPANVSMNACIGPVVKIDNKEQQDLNVHTTGKSINAIRTFTGKGILVWGARTLAGNDNEWRYVPVRRFFNMVEESTKKATEPLVFEPNDANTWTKVRVMIENFLTLQWRAGALQGAKPEDAFFVKVGLDETMTADDIYNGKMIVEIGMAVVRPAEFIILRFSHKMIEG